MVNIITFVVITKLIVKPLSIHIKHIKENDSLEIVGSYEFKYLALTYNDIYELNAENEKMLVHKAEHDSLTGLLNRAGFEDIKTLMMGSNMPIALAVLDIDKFKTVNDENGHEIGDEVLQTVAAQLRQSFRSCDYVIRLGGDEFVVILTNIRPENQNAVRRKFVNINEALRKPEGRRPGVSVSVGVAFSGNGFTDDLFEKADKMLYEVKNNGKCGCRFYEETEKIHPDRAVYNKNVIESYI